MCSKEVGELYSKRQEIAEQIIKIRLWLSRQGVKISADGKTLWWPIEKKCSGTNNYFSRASPKLNLCWERFIGVNTEPVLHLNSGS